jgi:hypothetical protein
MFRYIDRHHNPADSREQNHSVTFQRLVAKTH